MKKEEKHNGIISFWKFAFAMMIVFFHSRIFGNSNDKILFTNGYIGVEFFFLVSGYLLFKTALNKDNSNIGKDTINFLLKKIKVFLPYTILAGIITLVILKIYTNINIYKIILSIFDIFLLRMSGLKINSINNAIWYISSMLLCMAILYPLIRKYKYNFVYLVCPLIVILGFGYLNHNYGSLSDFDKWIGLTYKGNIRAFLELSLGGILYVICERIKNINFTKLGSILITIIEILGFLTPFIMPLFIDNIGNYDYVVVVIIAISITLAFSGKTLEFKLFNNKLFYWLEKLSLSIYIFHCPVRTFMINFPRFKEMTYISKLSIFIPMVIIISTILMYLLNYLKTKNYYLDKVKNLLIEK